MNYLSFTNGDKIPALGLGTWKSIEGEGYRAIREAIQIGYRHFDNIKMGIGAATVYLMLPYTGIMTGRIDHGGAVLLPDQVLTESGDLLTPDADIGLDHTAWRDHFASCHDRVEFHDPSPYPALAAATNARSSTANAKSTSSRVMHIGGLILKTLP